MRVGVIADIHGNVQALKTTLEYMKHIGCSEYLLLGDYVSDTASPIESMDLLYDLMKHYPCHALRGNREEYMLSQRAVRNGKSDGPVWISGSGSGNLLYTYEKLRERDFEFFSSLPICFRYSGKDSGGPDITCVHGSMDNSRHLLQVGAADTKKELASADTNYLIAAHTHIQGRMDEGGRSYLNTGSLGLAIGAPGHAHSIILESSGEKSDPHWDVHFLALPYDVRGTIADLFDRGLHEMAPWFINNNIYILRNGVDLTVELVELAKKLKTQREGADNWPMVEEKYYEEAAFEVGIPNYTRDMALAAL